MNTNTQGVTLREAMQTLLEAIPDPMTQEVSDAYCEVRLFLSHPPAPEQASGDTAQKGTLSVIQRDDLGPGTLGIVGADGLSITVSSNHASQPYRLLYALARSALSASTATPPHQEQAAPDGWLPISTAPKDGTEILVMRAGDEAAYVASWQEYPGNPVLDEAGDDSWMHGWVFKNPYLIAGGNEEGFLGWDDDPMPTH